MKRLFNYVMIFAGAVLFAFGFYLMRTNTGLQGVVSTLPYICVGVGCGIFGYGLGDILNLMARKKYPEMAKQFDIEEKDERNVMISNEAKAKGYTMMVYVFSALLLIYIFMSASLTIILPFIAAYLFVMFYVLYQRFKLEKKQ